MITMQALASNADQGINDYNQDNCQTATIDYPPAGDDDQSPANDQSGNNNTQTPTYCDDDQTLASKLY